MHNREIIEILNSIADMLEIKGDVIYKIRAYRRAAEAIGALGHSIEEVWREGKLTDIPGIGKAISEKIDELITTGKLDYFQKLSEEIPPSLAELMDVPDMGPKKVALVWKELGISNLEELEQAVRAGKLRDLPGLGEKSEAKILDGIESLKRRTGRSGLGDAWEKSQSLIEFLGKQPGVEQVVPAGSLRRMKSTIGDLDLLAASENPEAVMNAFINHPQVYRIIGQGNTKSSVEFTDGTRAQLWVHPPERFGTALQYATGSKDHNVRLREIALTNDLSLSEHALTKTDGSEILCSTEEEVYQHLGLPWIPPELREDRGEVQAARSGKLPDLIENQDILSELHTHSTWSDGRVTIREMVEEAMRRGYKTIAVTDHSHSLGIVQGVDPDELLEQRTEIETLRKEFGQAILILHGIELEIKADGSLDFQDDVLEWLDIVIASLHVSLRQPREQITERLLNAIQNPHVDIIGHPTGRLIPDREGADLDMDRLLEYAAKSGVALEINANPKRLDLDDIYARRAVELGIPMSINTDAHHPDQMGLMQFGVSAARRAWISPAQVINTWQPAELLNWLKARG